MQSTLRGKQFGHAIVHSPLFVALSFTHPGTPSGITTTMEPRPLIPCAVHPSNPVSRGVRPIAMSTFPIPEPESDKLYSRLSSFDV